MERPYAQIETLLDRLERPQNDAGVLQETLRLLRDALAARFRLSDELREREEQYRSFFNSPILGAAQASTPTGRLVQVNARLCEMTGYTEAELLGMSFKDLTHPEDRPRCDHLYNRLLAGELPSYVIEKRYMRKDGEAIWVQISVALVRDADGRPRWSMGMIEDIQFKKQAEAQLRAAKDAAEAANRSKDQFLATVSHELRNPLNAILGWAQLLKLRKPDTETFAAAVDSIEHNGRALARLIEDMLDISRIAAGKQRIERREVDLAEIVRRASDSMRFAARDRNVQLECAVPGEGSAIVCGDARRLEQVICNLVGNAIKFTPAGGSVQAQMDVSDGKARVSVVDTGCGIEPEFLPHVFDRFAQAESSRGQNLSGLGLGLSIVRSLVELHGGTVEAHSEGSGKGSTFTVRLPLAVGVGARMSATGPGAAEAVVERPRARPGLRILLVEDHADTARLMSRLLRSEGHGVVVARSVNEALSAAAGSECDVVVSDLGLPDGSGHDLMRQLLAGGRRLAGVALSGYGSAEDVAGSIEAGFAEHLVKPVSFDTLCEALARVALKRASAAPVRPG